MYICTTHRQPRHLSLVYGTAFFSCLSCCSAFYSTTTIPVGRYLHTHPLTLPLAHRSPQTIPRAIHIAKMGSRTSPNEVHAGSFSSAVTEPKGFLPSSSPKRTATMKSTSISSNPASSSGDFSSYVRLNVVGTTQLYGRTSELETIREAFRRVIQGHQQQPQQPVIPPPEHQQQQQQQQQRVISSSEQGPEIILVHGTSGTGKSSLVKAFQNSVREKHGNSTYIVEGKFDQNTDSSRPYSAIVDAVTQLCYSVGESDCIQEIQDSVEKNLSNEIGLLSNLIPAMHVLTSGMHVPEKQGTARNTGNYAFRLFMDSFCSFLKVVCDIRPVVLFLDDLQWADSASQQLISKITSDATIQRLVFIGAFRDDELEPGSVLSWIGNKASQKRTTVDIPMGPLDESSLNQMIADLLEQRPEKTEALSEIVSRKTGRNAYFVVQYLDMLQRRRFISFSFKSNRWEWDLEQIEGQTNVSDNVVELLANKIDSMPDDVQKVLMMAACLGFVVDENALEQIVVFEGLLVPGKKEDEQWSSSNIPSLSKSVIPRQTEDSTVDHDVTEKRLALNRVEESRLYRVAHKRAMKEGLIEKAADGKFKFSHDRVQQAAYSLMPSGDEGVDLHIRVGEILLKMSTSADGEEWMFFAAVDLFSKFASHFSDAEARVELALLCLEAGRIAEIKSAFLPATRYLKIGITMLNPADRWTKHYDLCLELHTKAAEVGRTHGDFVSTLALVKETLNHAKCFKDKLRVLHVKTYVLAGQDKLLHAIDACREVLKELGVNLPSNPKNIHVLIEYVMTKRLLKRRKPRVLMSLPLISDEMQTQAILFLNAAAIFAWHADLETVASFVFLKMMRLTLKHGLCKFSPFAFATFGMLLAAVGDHNGGYEYGRVALELGAQLEGSRECIASTTVVVESCLTHLKKPLYDSLAPIMEGHTVGMQTGEIEFAALCLSGHGGMNIVLGTRLDNMEQTLLNYGTLTSRSEKECDGTECPSFSRPYCYLVPFFREYNQTMAEGLSAPWLQFTMNLQGKASDPLVLTGDGMNEEEFIRHQTANNHMMAVRNLHLVKMILLYIFGDLEAAEQSRLVWEEGTGAEGTHYMMYLSILFSGLTCLGLARRYPKKRARYLVAVRRYIKKLERLVKNGAVNALLILRFLRAEQLALKDEDLSVVRKAFEETIRLAGRTGFRLINALACERIGHYILVRREPLMAADYLQQAWIQVR